MALQIIDSVIPGETYRFSMNGALTGWNQNGIKFQIVQLNAPGNADDVLLVDFTLGSVGGGQQNTFKLIDTAYTAQVLTPVIWHLKLQKTGVLGTRLIILRLNVLHVLLHRYFMM